MKKLIPHTAALLAAFIAAAALASVACKKDAPKTDSAQQRPVWHTFSYEEYNGILYTAWEAGTAKGVLCGTIAGISGSVRLNHACTAEQFEVLKERLVENGADYLGTADEPDLDGYPDLSAYLPFVMSSDERDALWRSLGLE
ncbi:MAG: hypothetical protein K2H09_10625 [Treponemataceae bacterium]|nr:hypothetical protein [Treponemataceae bacterium]